MLARHEEAKREAEAELTEPDTSNLEAEEAALELKLLLHCDKIAALAEGSAQVEAEEAAAAEATLEEEEAEVEAEKERLLIEEQNAVR